jgi:hypothetical protein
MKNDPTRLGDIEQPVVPVEDEHPTDLPAMNDGAKVRKRFKYSDRGQHLLIEAITGSLLPRLQSFLETPDISLRSHGLADCRT